jgi:hypothetical protein
MEDLATLGALDEPTPVAAHPGGETSLRVADQTAAALERSRRLRRLPREPLFFVPFLMAVVQAFGLFST